MDYSKLSLCPATMLHLAEESKSTKIVMAKQHYKTVGIDDYHKSITSYCIAIIGKYVKVFYSGNMKIDSVSHLAFTTLWVHAVAHHSGAVGG